MNLLYLHGVFLSLSCLIFSLHVLQNPCFHFINRRGYNQSILQLCLQLCLLYSCFRNISSELLRLFVLHIFSFWNRLQDPFLNEIVTSFSKQLITSMTKPFHSTFIRDVTFFLLINTTLLLLLNTLIFLDSLGQTNIFTKYWSC